MEYKISENWPSNLLMELVTEDFLKDWKKPDDFEGSLAYALFELTEKERICVVHRFRYGLSYSEIAKLEGVNVTGSRVNQIVNKALRRLRHPVRLGLITGGVANAFRPTTHTSTSVPKRPDDSTGELETNQQTAETGDIYDIVIDYLDLSTRAYNIMARSDLRSVRDIVERFQDGSIIKLRNMGSRTVDEIRTTLLKVGVDPEELQFKEEVYRAKMAKKHEMEISEDQLKEIESQVLRIGELKKEAAMLPAWEFIADAMRRIENECRYKDVVGVIVKTQDPVKDEEGSCPWAAYIQQIPPEVRYNADYEDIDRLSGVRVQRFGFRKREMMPRLSELLAVRVENLGFEAAVINELRTSGISNAGQCFSGIATGYPAINPKLKTLIAERLVQIGLGTISIKTSPNPMGVLRMPHSEPFMESTQLDPEDNTVEPRYLIPITDLDISDELKDKAAHFNIKVAAQLCGLISQTADNLKYRTNPFDWNDTVKLHEALLKVGFTRAEINNPGAGLKKAGEVDVQPE